MIKQYWDCPVCGVWITETPYRLFRQEHNHHGRDPIACIEITDWEFSKKAYGLQTQSEKAEGVMKCESCGQEKPKARLFPGDIVEIDNACVWAGLAVITKVDYSKPSPFYLIPFTGRYKGIEGSFMDNQLEKVHGYVHINRTEMDYTRHAL